MTFTATVRKVDGKLTMTVPQNVALKRGLQDGCAVDVDLVEGRLILKPIRSK